MSNKKLLLSLTVVFALVVMITGCYKDKEELLYPASGALDCADSTVQKGPMFTAVETIIKNECVSCHATSANGGTDQSPILSTACNIVDNWSPINSACVVNKSMPTSGPLSAANQQAITSWVNAGHKYTD